MRRFVGGLALLVAASACSSGGGGGANGGSGGISGSGASGGDAGSGGGGALGGDAGSGGGGDGPTCGAKGSECPDPCAAEPVDDGNPCTQDACDAATGVTHLPVAAGLACPDDNACNGEERCDAMGTCTPAAPLVVDDGDACTKDACTAAEGVSHTLVPGCAGANPGKQFETRASIMGRVIQPDGAGVSQFSVHVFNDTLTSVERSDVAATINPDGSFRVRLLEFPQSVVARTPPQHILIQIRSDDFPTLLRGAYLNPGDVVALGDLMILPRDPNVTAIGPEGGTAQDSQGTLASSRRATAPTAIKTSRRLASVARSTTRMVRSVRASSSRCTPQPGATTPSL